MFSAWPGSPSRSGTSEWTGCPVSPVQSATITVPGITVWFSTACMVSPRNRKSPSTVITAATVWSTARLCKGMAAACSAIIR